MMREFVPGRIWLKDIPLRFLGVPVGARMTVIRLVNDVLFLHSPTRLDDQTRQELSGLGRVRYIVSPNNMHHFFIAEYFEEYPMAQIYASPGLVEKRRDLTFRY